MKGGFLPISTFLQIVCLHIRLTIHRMSQLTTINDGFGKLSPTDFARGKKAAARGVQEIQLAICRNQLHG